MTARRRTEGPRAAALVLVLALHGLLLWHGSAVRPDARFESRAPAPVVVAVRIAPSSPVREAPPPPTGESAPRRAPPRITPATAAQPLSREPTAATAEPAAPQTLEARPGSVTDAAAVPGPPTEAVALPPTDRPLNLVLPRGAGAERSALTEPPGSMRRAALNDPRSNIAPDPTRVLPDAVAASAKGGCMKGDYSGGGGGLLSLPFLAVAALRGDCKPVR